MPKEKITRQMVLDAAFAIARARGVQSITARSVSQELGCSTQPVMYHFATIEELKRAVYEKADWFHTEYLMDVRPQGDAMLQIGLNYVRFAVDEPHLFRLLFQSGFAVEHNVLEMINSEELVPVLSAMQAAMELDLERTKTVFLTLALFVHGYASLIVNNALELDEKLITGQLEQVYRGAILALEEEQG